MFSLAFVCPKGGGYPWSHVPSGGWWICLVQVPFRVGYVQRGRVCPGKGLGMHPPPPSCTWDQNRVGVGTPCFWIASSSFSLQCNYWVSSEVSHWFLISKCDGSAQKLKRWPTCFISDQHPYYCWTQKKSFSQFICHFISHIKHRLVLITILLTLYKITVYFVSNFTGVLQKITNTLIRVSSIKFIASFSFL